MNYFIYFCMNVFVTVVQLVAPRGAKPEKNHGVALNAIQAFNSEFLFRALLCRNT